MRQIARWGNFTFFVSANMIRSFTNFTIKNSCDTDTKNCQGQDYLTPKGIKPAEVSFNVQLNALAGCNVQSDAQDYLYAARAGLCDYIYIGSTKLLPFQFRLIETNITDLVLSPSGKWISCTVKLTMKQGSQDDSSSTSGSDESGEGDGGKSGGVGGSEISRANKTAKKVSVVAAVAAASVGVAVSVAKAVSTNRAAAATAVINKANAVKRATAPAPKPIVKPALTQSTKVKRTTR